MEFKGMSTIFVIQRMKKNIEEIQYNGSINAYEVEAMLDTWENAINQEGENFRLYLKVEKLLEQRDTLTNNEAKKMIEDITKIQSSLIDGRNDVIGYTIRNTIISEIMDKVES